MKKLWYLLGIVLIGVGCTNEKEAPATEKEKPTTEETVVISLAQKFSEWDEPLRDMTRTGENNDLYGFQVWVNQDGQTFEPNIPFNVNNTPVCAGVFDNLENIKIELSTKHTYNVQMVYIPNGKNLIYQHSSGCYEYPFMMQKWTPTPLNKIVFISNDFMTGLDLCLINSHSNSDRASDMWRTGVDYYYGESLNIIPKADGVISVDMKNMVWGLTLRAKKVEDKVYERFIVTIDVGSGSQKVFYMPIDQSKEVTELVIPKILLSFTSTNAGRYYDSENVNNSIKFNVGTDANPSELINTKINLKRNMMKVIEFDATNEKYDQGVDIVIGDEEMKEDIEIL